MSTSIASRSAGHLRPGSSLCLTLIALALTSPALGKMYRYVDENGVTVYSQSPPASGSATAIEAQPGPSAAESEAAASRLKRQMEQEQDRREDQRKAADDASKKASEDSSRESNCEIARKNLETIRNLGSRRIKGPDGQYVRMSLEDRDKAMAEARKQIDKNCK